MCLHFFFFIDTATTGIYTYVHTLSQHDALPIPRRRPPYRKPRLTEPPHRDGRPFTVGTDEDVCPTCNGSGRVLNAVPTEWRGSQISGLYRYPTNKILDPIKRRLHSVPKSAAAGPDGWRMRRVADNGQNGNEHAVRADQIGRAHV